MSLTGETEEDHRGYYTILLQIIHDPLLAMLGYSSKAKRRGPQGLLQYYYYYYYYYFLPYIFLY